MLKFILLINKTTKHAHKIEFLLYGNLEVKCSYLIYQLGKLRVSLKLSFVSIFKLFKKLYAVNLYYLN